MRSLRLGTEPLEELDVDLIAVPVRKGGSLPEAAGELDERFGGALGRRIDEGGFRGEDGETSLFPAGEGTGPHVLAVGRGEDAGEPEERVRRASGEAVRAAREARVSSLAFLLDPGDDAPPARLARAAAEGLGLGDWSYDELRGEEAHPELAAPPARAVIATGGSRIEGGEAAVRQGRLRAEAQNWARSLVARPPNVVTPRDLARRAGALDEQFDLEVELWDRERLREDGFGALLAVARGSSEEPRFIRVEHRGSDERPYVLIGKGITFDSGGLSLKPADGMEEMKYDMAGAAAALGAVRGAASLGLPRRVVALVPAAENLPSGSALRPSDVIRGVSGTSIEVVNTDAEGRLLLSDALAYARELNPRAVVDLATLTGGCVVALGHEAAGLMCDDDDLVEALETAGRRTGERVWRLPLWDGYRRELDSEIADIKNSGGRAASAITAGWFLKEFAGEYPWAHLDIAGTAWTEEDRAYCPNGATGVGVRLVLEWLQTAA